MEPVRAKSELASSSKYDPFRRSDVAVMDSAYELIKTVLLAPLIPVRALSLVILLAIYSALCGFASWGLPSHPSSAYLVRRTWWRVLVLAPGLYMCKLALLIACGMWVTVTPDSDWKVTNDKGEKAQIWVSNHVSYLDVLVYMASVEPVLGFVAKKSVFSLPLIGRCAWTWGCIAVDRDQKSGNTVVSELQDRVAHPERSSVVVFPEGTTSNGKYLIHFHRGAFAAGAPVKPAIIRYPATQFSPAWESATAPYHIFRLLTQFVNRVTVTLYPVYTPSAAEKADPGLYANNVHSYMAKVGGLKLSESGIEEKKEYLSLLREGDKRLD